MYISTSLLVSILAAFSLTNAIEAAASSTMSSTSYTSIPSDAVATGNTSAQPTTRASNSVSVMSQATGTSSTGTVGANGGAGGGAGGAGTGPNAGPNPTGSAVPAATGAAGKLMLQGGMLGLGMGVVGLVL